MQRAQVERSWKLWDGYFIFQVHNPEWKSADQRWTWTNIKILYSYLLIDWLIDFSDMSTRLGLFYAKQFANHAHCTFKYTFFCLFCLVLFCFVSWHMKIVGFFNVKSFIYIYIYIYIYIWFGLVLWQFNVKSCFYIYSRYMICKHIL